MEERLNKLLSSMGVCSRREADRLIAEGRVLVDGNPAVVGQKAGPGQRIVCDGTVICDGTAAGGGTAICDGPATGGGTAICDGPATGGGTAICDGPAAGGATVICDGTAIRGAMAICDGPAVRGDRPPAEARPAPPQQFRRPAPVLLAVNKPRGVVCTASDKDRAPNIVEMIHYPSRVYYTGRLDKDSEGLVLMTNQGDLVNKIMRSGNAHEKEYLVTVDRPVTAAFLEKLRGGVWLEELEKTTLPCKVEQTGVSSIRIILIQGLNRQIRRMCRACGCNVVTLKRVRVMNICLDGLESGSYRHVEGEEYQKFLKLLARPAGNAPAGPGISI